jgi:hypothetical protein
MDRQLSIQITDQSSFHILLFPKELFTKIASFMLSKSQLALAHTCKKIYNYHKEQCKEEEVAFLCSPPSNVYGKYLFKHWLSKAGWAAVKVILKEISTDSQSNNSYLLISLCLNESLQFPNELKCESINALILEFSIRALSTLLNISFWENFPNLKVLRLSHIVVNKNIASVLSKLPLLKIISLNYCDITDDNISKIIICNRLYLGESKARKL